MLPGLGSNRGAFQPLIAVAIAATLNIASRAYGVAMEGLPPCYIAM
ncbi:hypothetical protein A2U01_0039423, partial [Trifolium medium]|nr:hypothetical protein [Trifolium medium]